MRREQINGEYTGAKSGNGPDSVTTRAIQGLGRERKSIISAVQ